jgi:hypothetical protein
VSQLPEQHWALSEQNPLTLQQVPDPPTSQMPWQHSPAMPVQVSPNARQQREGLLPPHAPSQQAVPAAEQPVLPTAMQPHWPAVPLPPQAFGAVHIGQATVRTVPQTSGPVAVPHCTPSLAQSWASVSGVQAQVLDWQVVLGGVVHTPQFAVRMTPQWSGPV